LNIIAPKILFLGDVFPAKLVVILPLDNSYLLLKVTVDQNAG